MLDQFIIGLKKREQLRISFILDVLLLFHLLGNASVSGQLKRTGSWITMSSASCYPPLQASILLNVDYTQMDSIDERLGRPLFLIRRLGVHVTFGPSKIESEIAFLTSFSLMNPTSFLVQTMALFMLLGRQAKHIKRNAWFLSLNSHLFA